MLDAGRDEHQVARSEGVAALTVAENAAAGNDDIDFVARMRRLRVEPTWGIDLDLQARTLEDLGGTFPSGPGRRLKAS